MPPYNLKMPQGANIDAQITNGTQPNQGFKKKFTKTKNPNPFSEKPQFIKP